MHACVGLQLRWRGSGMEESEWNKCFSFSFFSPVCTGEEWEWATPCCPTTSASRDEGQLFDDALVTLIAECGPNCARLLHPPARGGTVDRLGWGQAVTSGGECWSLGLGASHTWLQHSLARARPRAGKGPGRGTSGVFWRAAASTGERKSWCWGFASLA